MVRRGNLLKGTLASLPRRSILNYSRWLAPVEDPTPGRTRGLHPLSRIVVASLKSGVSLPLQE
eukprot:7603259-Pyramimonas_sp.AAC.1